MVDTYKYYRETKIKTLLAKSCNYLFPFFCNMFLFHLTKNVYLTNNLVDAISYGLLSYKTRYCQYRF